MAQATRQLAVITGASSGIGFELAKIAIKNGFDLIIASDENRIHDAAKQLAASGASVTPIQADLATEAGVGNLYAAIGAAGRPVDVLMANAGLGRPPPSRCSSRR
jgi:short-subunit dehydrogenase